MATSKFRSHDEASKWAQEQGIATEAEWQRRYRMPGFPTDLPFDFRLAYKKYFKGTGDFFGTGRIPTYEKVFRSYEDAQAWAVENNIKTLEQWKEASRQNDFPEDLPKKLHKTYRKDWSGSAGFFGTNNVRPGTKTYMSYSEASAWAQSEGITTSTMWLEACRKKKIPHNIPTNPSVYYEKFTTFGEFLGTGYLSNQKWAFKNYDDASAWVQSQGITGQKQWRDLCKDPNFPQDIPKYPSVVYADVFNKNGGLTGFLGQVKLVGRSKIETALKRALSYCLDLDPSHRTTILVEGQSRPIAVDIIDRSRGLIVEYDGWYWHKGPEKETRDQLKSDKLNACTPAWTIVRVREAPLGLLDPSLDVIAPEPTGKFGPMVEIVMRHLLALVREDRIINNGLDKKIAHALQHPLQESDYKDIFQVGWRSYAEASAWAQSEGITTVKQWQSRTKEPGFPDDIPVNPERVYGHEFKGYGAFLGTGNIRRARKDFASLEEASLWAQERNIKTITQWLEYCKRDDFPDHLRKDISAYPGFRGTKPFFKTGKYAIKSEGKPSNESSNNGVSELQAHMDETAILEEEIVQSSPVVRLKL